ncbi:HEAT repeat domain-containing protein [Candidatus Poribacteria bacterium]|nr:HEAT repeat domain-containing protein [Candidatus Poribacteria bacterium]
MDSYQLYKECPQCGEENIQKLDINSWFCLDCDWDNLSTISNDNDELVSSLLHGDIHSRRIAAQSLINIGDAERHIATQADTQTLINALDDEDSDVRYFVAVALGKLEATLSLAKLKDIAQNDNSALVRQGASTAIEQIEEGFQKKLISG